MNNETVDGKKVLSIEDARQYLGGISRNTLYRLFKSNDLKSFTVNKRRFVLKSEIDSYIDARIEVGI